MMDIIVVAGLGLCGAWLVSKLFSIGEKTQPRNSGVYVSQDYQRRCNRAIRSEFTANRLLAGGR